MVDQRLEPDDETEAGAAWQSLGTVQVAEVSSEVEIAITQAEPGLFAADGIRLRRVEPVLQNIEQLRLDDNPLDNRAHELFLPDPPELPALDPAAVTIDTDHLTVTGDDASEFTFYGAPFTFVAMDGQLAVLTVEGDLHIDADTIQVQGNLPLSIRVANDIFIDRGTVFDVAADLQAGPGGGAGVAGGTAGQPGAGAAGVQPGGNGGSGGRPSLFGGYPGGSRKHGLTRFARRRGGSGEPRQRWQPRREPGWHGQSRRSR